MRARLFLLGAAGIALALGAGDALSRQTAGSKARTPKAAPAAVFNAALARRIAADSAAAGPPAAGGGVDWKSAIEQQRRSNASGAGEKMAGGLDQDAVNQTRLPILLPVLPGLLASGRLYSFGDYYTLSTDLPGASVSFSGAAQPIPVAATLSVNAQGPENLIIERTVEGRVASFTRFGALYTVEIACDQPKDDRCVSDTFIRDMTAKTTAVVLGKAARQAAGMGG